MPAEQNTIRREVDLTTTRSYIELLGEIRTEVTGARLRAVRSVNTEMLTTYWRIGRMILEKQEQEGWGTSVIELLAADLRDEGAKGFSARNLWYMRKFAGAWPDLIVCESAFSPQPVGKMPPSSEFLPQPVAEIPWGHNRVLLDKLDDTEDRLWYAEGAASEGWSRAVLEHHIAADLKGRKGIGANNFPATIAGPDSDLAAELLADPLDLSFVAGEDVKSERDLELALLRDIEKFMLGAGGGRLAFVGRQQVVEVGGDEFFIDLLFFHVGLLRYVVVELKIGKFAPEFTGKLNFYVAAVDGEIRTEKHGPTIGILLCAALNSQVVEYSLDRLGSPLGVTTYELDGGRQRKELPTELRDELPGPDQLEAGLRRLVDERREDVEALLELSTPAGAGD
jgi:predicted nuclease of restriction endonuclease-like (RecB) superfamily